MYILSGLARAQGLCHGFSTRTLDHKLCNQSFRWGKNDEVIENRRRFLTTLGCEYARLENLICMIPPFEPITSKTVACVGKNERGCGSQTIKSALAVEALITTDRHVFLFLASADCPPVILYDPAARVLALVHCSREMTEKQLLERVIGMMREEFGVDSQNIVAGIGPGISRHSYLLGYFKHEDDPEWRSFCKRYEDKIAVDLYGFNRELLRRCGLKAKNIFCSRRDTARDDTFFSHARSLKTGEPEGRNAVVVGMV